MLFRSNDTATTEIYTVSDPLSLHDALPISLASKPEDFLNRPGGWPETRYEAKARRLGHEVWYMRYRRI